jgi:hypothetical protein
MKTLMKNEYAKILFIMLLTGAMFVAERYVYSPFYWLNRAIPFLQNFRTPQRMFMPMTSVMIAFLALAAQEWLRNKPTRKTKLFVGIICVSSLLWTGIVSWRIFYNTFEPIRYDLKQIAIDLRKKDPSNYFVVSFIPRMQLNLVEQKIPIANYYYGWENKNLPHYLPNDTFLASKEFADHRPKYIISDVNQPDFSKYSYSVFFKSGTNIVWRTESPTITPVIRFN